MSERLTVLNRVKDLLSRLTVTAKSRIVGIRHPIKWVVLLYFGLVTVLVLTYYAAWLWLWKEGEVALSDLLSLIREMVGGGMIAFITFIAGCMVDTDKDGIPDQFEKEEGKE